jgi:hypothetical protein
MAVMTIAITGSPFLGLPGTVIGVMINFAVIAATGDVNVTCCLTLAALTGAGKRKTDIPLFDPPRQIPVISGSHPQQPYPYRPRGLNLPVRK